MHPVGPCTEFETRESRVEPCQAAALILEPVIPPKPFFPRVCIARVSIEIGGRIPQTIIERLGPGTLYETIQRLEQRGLIEESPHRPDPDQDHSQRRYYRLTEDGRRVLEDEVARLERVVNHARSRLAAR